ncbi:LLM class flavin-dependent oxidoreductase [Actinocorallia sp. A-T 12471]|uniref:LLM class flavin-dependent oxidoreductase n=1 Tax=Actinocorallia sp. A-T 12471 TaxID=3089813 RepID=UPI0029CF40B0|nr:LLM class flavin-dependent oxidoreductase [Actinocorallia sp. A-T 12471]MDX6744234.1 LLM class flavin-dependent oxidoreductase [Actinocorallia sp. A-T 12471]
MSAILGQRLVFGAGGAVAGLTAAATLDLARSADELGFDLFTLSDHLHSTRPTVEPMTALATVAARTERIEIGTNVLGLPYRSPAVVAKTAETLDALSGGRFVLGLGGGGFDAEFTAFGLTERTPGGKVDALREAVTIMRDLWSGGPGDFVGRHFSTRGARIDPLPAHPIPIWLGSYGPRSLALTGELADGWLPSLGRIGLPEAVARRAQVHAAAEKAGRDPSAITCACNLIVRIDPTRTPTPELVAGTPKAVAAQLIEIAKAGFTAQLLSLPTTPDQELIAKEVLPQVRTALP